MGMMLRFSSDGSSPNNFLSSCCFSTSRPTIQDASTKEVPFILLVLFGFSSFTVKPRSNFSLYSWCNLVLILSNL
ncbi:hypothetical protein Hanom_Chr04g00283681 [Helianthus anomalus]